MKTNRRKGLEILLEKEKVKYQGSYIRDDARSWMCRIGVAWMEGPDLVLQPGGKVIARFLLDEHG